MRTSHSEEVPTKWVGLFYLYTSSHHTLTFLHPILSKFYLLSLKFIQKASARDFWASARVEMS